jgi:antitoxin component of MazEF toxin-antitoxin module
MEMIKTLTTVGNSKALIIPADLIKKYGLEKVIIEETTNGILIRSAEEVSDFQKKLNQLKKYKSEIYLKMELEAREPEVINYYSDPKNNLSDVDPEIL